MPRERHGNHGEAEFSCVDDGQNYSSLGPCPGSHRPDRDAATRLTLNVVAGSGNTRTLAYSLPAAGVVSIAVFDIAGRGVSTLDHGTRAAGIHTMSWDAKGLARGMYFLRMQAGSMTTTKAFMVLRTHIHHRTGARFESGPHSWLSFADPRTRGLARTQLNSERARLAPHHARDTGSGNHGAPRVRRSPAADVAPEG